MRRLSSYLIFLFSFFTYSQIFSQQSTINSLSDEIKFADNTTPFTVRNIVIVGNKKTKSSIIIRELPFKPGYQFPLPVLVAKFDDARRQLMNTTLFHEVTVSLKSIEGYNVDILIEVKERWYLFPFPYFKFVDRNLNEWLVKNNASLKRVNYGVKVIDQNVTGRRDNMDMWLMNGYTKQIALNYDRLYFDNKMQWGGKIGLSLGENHEVNYNTLNNKQLFFKDTINYVRSFFKSNFEITYRRATKTRHRFGFGFTQERVKDTVIKLNPNYFGGEKNVLRYPEIYYAISYNDVDYIPYPLTGFEWGGSFRKKGFNHAMNDWELNFNTGNYWQLSPKWFFSVTTNGTLKLPLKQPYYNTRLMGYGDMFMRGYEYYVMDGTVGGYVQANFSRQILNVHIPLPKSKHWTLNYLPLKIYGKVFGSSGYVYNANPVCDPLNNRMLYSAGFGVDILTSYDVNISLEWSFNQIGQNGLYLHKNDNF